MSKMKINIVVKGDPKTKKNSLRIAKRKDGTPFVLQSKQYEAYERDFINQTRIYHGTLINAKSNVKCVYYRRTKRRVDLTNLLGCTMDCLTKAKILEDDNCNIAYSHDGSYVDFDKENPRVEIEIEVFE